MSNPPYKKIHVVVNPAAGKDEPILNVLNDVFHQYGVEWSVSITKKFGDAKEQARKAAENGADLVAGYGGDGTQHEIANGILETDAVMGVLPGGTGNGFATELGTPKELKPALELLCTSAKLRPLDVVQMEDGSYFVQRLYVGIEPEEQTSREDKNKYGTFAYAINTYKQGKSAAEKQVNYRVTLDGKVSEFPAMKLYVINAAKAGTGISITGGYSKPDDGLVDVFVLDLHNLKTLSAATERMLNIRPEKDDNFIMRAKEVTIETTPDQPVWTDGEYVGRTPVTMKVVPGALKVVVP